MQADEHSPKTSWLVHWLMDDDQPPFCGQHGPYETHIQAEQKAEEMRNKGVGVGRIVHTQIVESVRTWNEETQEFEYHSAPKPFPRR